MLYHDGNVQMRQFDRGGQVAVRNVPGGEARWLPGVVVARKGTLSYLVRVQGKIRYVDLHADHLRSGDYEKLCLTHREQKQNFRHRVCDMHPEKSHYSKKADTAFREISLTTCTYGAALQQLEQSRTVRP